MQAETEYELDQGRHRIIRRPRLTRMLDAATARIVLLSAPAGYGKTLLGLEWLEEREHVWFRGSSAIADVAALALGLADAVDRLVPGAEPRMRERLRASMEPAREVDSLAGLLGDDLDRWPEGAWLAIDDYQFAVGSAPSEEFIERLSAHPRLRLLLTSRQRPGWVSARKVLYGEVFELGAHALAMEEDEANEVFSRSGGKAPPGLVALVEGWPAVIGLAALTDDFAVPEGALSEGLYDYFAEELYAAASPELQWQLCQLAIAPRITRSLAEHLFGADAKSVTDTGIALGFLHPTGAGHDMHPLLRTFLEAKLREHPRIQTLEVIRNISDHLVNQGDWEPALSLAYRYQAIDLLLHLLHVGTGTMLLQGHVSTLDYWVSATRALDAVSPTLDLTAAEIAVRTGEHTKAEALAAHTARALPSGHSYAPRLWAIAGQAAHLMGEDDRALGYYTHARDVATTELERVEALWGHLLSSTALEREEAFQYLTEIEQLEGSDAAMAVRIATARAQLKYHTGNLSGVREELLLVYPLATYVGDPMLRTSFLNMFAFTLGLAGHYKAALEVVDELQLDIERWHLYALSPYVAITRSVAELGLRHFAQVEQLLTNTDREAERLGQPYLRMTSGAMRAKASLSRQRFAEAVVLTASEWQEPTLRSLQGERAGLRALALACCDEFDEALAVADEAEHLTRAIEPSTTAPWARAIVAFRKRRRDASALVLDAFALSRSVGCADSFVCAYRSQPQLLGCFTSDRRLAAEAAAIVDRARDLALGRRYGLPVTASLHLGLSPLSKREQQVYELLAEGRTNKEIAKALYITESTVKVHVRHILAKLGLRSRTEVAVRAAVERSQAAAPSDSLSPP